MHVQVLCVYLCLRESLLRPDQFTVSANSAKMKLKN